MAETVQQAPCFYVEVPDQAGQGATILSGLKEAGINLLAFTGFPIGGGKAQFNFVPENVDAFRNAASNLGLSLKEGKSALLIEGDERIGAAADTLVKLADEGISLIASHAVTAGAGRYGMILWVDSADYDKASTALRA